MVTLAVVLDPSDIPVLGWAARIAATTGRPLRILCVTKATSAQLERIDPAARPSDLPELVGAALDAAATLDAKDVVVNDCRAPDVRRAVLDAVVEFNATLLVLHATVEEKPVLLPGMVHRLARAAPCDVLVIDDGDLATALPKRVLVPQLAGDGEHALLVATRGIAGPTAPVLALPDPARLPRSRRTFARLRERLPEARRERLSQRDPGDRALAETLPELVEADDLVLLDAEATQRVPKHLARLRELRRSRPDVRCAVAVARAADAHGPGRLERLAERIRLHAPHLDREQRKDLHARIEAGGRLSADFAVMLALSTGIAALGLIQSSTATVIGAMLVAPLMTPLVAAGMSIVQGNLKMLQDAMRALVIGIVGALVVALAIGMLSPWKDLSTEVLARGAPNLFDLGIALLSGMAAAYALARPGLAGTLVGVAIAVALVPPLAAVGIAIARGHPSVAFGAFVLFSTNFVAIILGTALTFWFFGLKVQRRDATTQAWVRGAVMTLMLGVLVVSAPLAHNLALQMREGVSRSLTKPLAPALRTRLLDRVRRTPDVDVVLMAQSNVSDGIEVHIILACRGEVDPELEIDLRRIVLAALGEDADTRITALRTADPATRIPVGSEHQDAVGR